MSKTKLLSIVLVAVIAVVLVGWLIWQSFIASPSYYAVYMTTGDLYFGQLDKFPSYGLSNIYTIQVNPNNQDNPLSIQRFRNLFWGPRDHMDINRDNVVWTVKLDSEGQLAQLIKNNPNLTPRQGGVLPQGQQGNTQQPAGGNVPVQPGAGIPQEQ